VGRPAGAQARDEARDTILRDGSSIIIREAVPGDEPALLAFLEHLDDESRRLRFASLRPDLRARAHRWAVPERPADVSLVAETGAGPGGARVVIGNATADQLGPERAEVAFVVAAAYQGLGVATLLIEELARRASLLGITTFHAEVLPENAKMLEVFRATGFPLRVHADIGELRVEFPTALAGEARARFERREQLAAAAAVRALLHPVSVAVVGASRRRGTVGGELLYNLLAGGFGGPVYPVNPVATMVQGVDAYRTIADVPGSVDLAVIAVPAPQVAGVVRECAGRDVKSVVVASRGFAEAGPEGVARQDELVAMCRGSGIRLVGPNSLGIINPDPEVRLNATFGTAFPAPGGVALLSQSGALGVALVDHANRTGLGLAAFVAIGNKADLTGNDFLQYWEEDPSCTVIALYLESLGNPRKFSRIARRVGRSKPVIAVKSGRSAAGARATTSHTGVRISQSDVTVEALFRQAGVVRTDTLGEFFDVASLLANQPLPRGRGVAILSNGGGPAILAADACEAAGLDVPPLPDTVRAELAALLPAGASLGNPVDAVDAGPEGYRDAIRVLAGCDAVHAIIVLFVPPLGGGTEQVASAIRDAVADLGREVPVLAVFMAAGDGLAALQGDGVRIPTYTYPEEAARALGHAARYASWRNAEPGVTPSFDDVRQDAATGVIATALARLEGATVPVRPIARSKTPGTAAPIEGQAISLAAPAAPTSPAGTRWLAPDEVAALLDCYGIAVAPWRVTATPQEAGQAAAELGGLVALKAVVADLVRKGEAGGVVLALEGAREVAAAAEGMGARLAAAGHTVDGFLVQRMVAEGTEMLVGVVHDRLFGPVIACGAGGGEVSRLRDVGVRITPLTDLDAHDLVTSLDAYVALTEPAMGPPADTAALEETLLRVSAMVEAHPEIAEMDLNPVIVLAEGAVVVDARIRIERVERG
jgi:acyl-CoA synthetase (NDP forming)/RimJ/RimL family protein N-acetyltransferase